MDFSFALDLKATNIATHLDRYQVTPEAFVSVLKELEIGIITITQMLLAVPLEGKPPLNRFKPSIAQQAKSEEKKEDNNNKSKEKKKKVTL